MKIERARGRREHIERKSSVLHNDKEIGDEEENLVKESDLDVDAVLVEADESTGNSGGST